MNKLTQVKRPLQIAFAVVVIGFITWTVIRSWDDFVSSVLTMQPVWLLGSLVAGFLGVFFSMLAWRAVVMAFGYSISVRDASHVVFVSQIGKYLPGGVWPIVAGSQLGARAGIPAGVTAITLTAQLLVSLIAGSTVAAGAFLAFPTLAASYGWLVVLAVAVGVMALLPPVLTRIIGFAFRLLRRKDSLPPIRALPLSAAIGWSLISWACFGVHLWTIVTSLGTFDPGLLPLAISGYALAWVAGFLAIIAPAGAGVREAILALVLTNVVAAGSVLGIVLVSRFGLIIVDVVVCLYALATTHIRPGTAAVGRPDAAPGPE